MAKLGLYSPEYWNMIWPTFIENWPAEVQRLAAPFYEVPWTAQEVYALTTNLKTYPIIARCKVGIEPQSLESLCVKIDDMLVNNKFSGFIRLGSRSPKDSDLAISSKLQVHSGKDAINLLTSSNHRMAQDIVICQRNNYHPRLFLTRWVPIPRWAEFRCFIIDGMYAGASQYHHGVCDFFPHEIGDKAIEIQALIGSFFSGTFPTQKFTNAVVDIYVASNGVRLIEINPFFDNTDPCLFKWSPRFSDFDGSFRYKTD